MQSSVSFPAGQSQPQLPQQQSQRWQTLGWKDNLPGNLRRRCAFQRCLPRYCSPPPLPTNLFGGNETALVCKPSPGSGARLCAINKSKCQSLRPASKASLPKEPGVATARARQHGQWSPRSHSRENNHPTLL